MPLSIKARCFNGKAYDLQLDGAKPSVADLQQSINSASGITPDRQTILFKGTVLDPSCSLSDYPLGDGSTISVVRRIGKSNPSAAPPTSTTSSTSPSATQSNAGATSATQTASKPPSSAKSAPAPGADDDGATASYEELMRSLNLGGAGAGAGAGAAGIEGLASMLGGGGMPGLGGGAGGGAGAPGAQAANMEQLFSQLPQMMNGLLSTPLFKEYLNNTEKQEQSREAILSNPFMRSILERDPEFATVVNDPDKWRQSMEAAKSLLPDGEEDPNADGDDAAAGEEASSSAPGSEAPRGFGADGKSKVMAAAATRQSAAQLAPPGLDIKKLSESYGHALGQSLINSGLGLDPDLVVRGLRTAVAGKPFPMSLPEYEREMATLQNIASEYLKKVNLEDANQFFEEINSENSAVVVLEEGLIAYETSEVDVVNSADKGDGGKTPGADTVPTAQEKATVLVIVSARLLDGRHFFTCPAADGKGDSVHPLTLPLETAPRALAKGIVGMKENESRLLYVHPRACEGMTEMFGDLLPPNALLIFDLQLVSADAPEEDTVGESYFNSA